MAKADFLDDALRVSSMKIAVAKVVVERQKAQLDAAGATTIVLENLREEAIALTASCHKELHLV